MAKTVAYFYDPDVGNFHYGASAAGAAAGLGGGAAAMRLRPRAQRRGHDPAHPPLSPFHPLSIPPLFLPAAIPLLTAGLGRPRCGWRCAAGGGSGRCAPPEPR